MPTEPARHDVIGGFRFSTGTNRWPAGSGRQATGGPSPGPAGQARSRGSAR